MAVGGPELGDNMACRKKSVKSQNMVGECFHR
jgi:hypothetical protein